MVKTRQQVEGVITRFVEKLKELGVTPATVMLYGSYSRGTAGEDSDIDLIVVSRDFEGMNLLQRLEVLGVAAARILEPVQAKGYTPEEFEAAEEPFLREIIKHAKVAA